MAICVLTPTYFGSVNNVGVEAIRISFVYKDYHDMTESEMKSAGMGNGIEKVTVGTLKEGGALAWIYTDCGTYTVSIKSLTLSDKNCELCFGWQLNGIYTDKSLEPEYWED